MIVACGGPERGILLQESREFRQFCVKWPAFPRIGSTLSNSHYGS